MKKIVGSVVMAIAMQFSTGYAQDIPLSERFTLDGCYAAAKSQKSRDAAVAAAAAQYRRDVLAAQAKEARKARAAYLISYIISVGNWIDDHPDPDDHEKVAKSWSMIMETQDELQGIYATELRISRDPATIATLRENIAKLTVGRQYAKNQLVKLGRDFPKSW